MSTGRPPEGRLKKAQMPFWVHPWVLDKIRELGSIEGNSCGSVIEYVFLELIDDVPENLRAHMVEKFRMEEGYNV